MAERLLHTKFFIPRTRPLQVPRQRLIDKLHQGLNRRVTLISAPAGFGKTTALVQWLQQCEQTAVWLSLDEADNDPFTCFKYLAAVVNKLPNVGYQLRIQLQEQQIGTVNDFMMAFLDDVTAVSTPFLLILDDYHVITNPKIEQAIAWLIDHIPSSMHLVLTSRAEPGFPLSRLRVQGELNELREADLRFTLAESTHFLKNVMALPLSENEITTLEARTEGWITGLQMAALSLQTHADTTAFITAFSGSNRYILDYLTEEVIEQQPPEIQEFLLKTAVLPRLSAPLCQAITKNARSQQILEQLEAHNLFIIPLDDNREWYRYHALFADLLRNRLQRTHSKQIPALHKRAAIWFATNGDARTAVHHALTIKDHRLAGQIIQDNWRKLFHQGWINTTLRWIESLPPDLRQQFPPLNVAYCWTLAIRGDTHRIPPYLAQAEAALDELIMQQMVPDSHPEYDFLAGQFDLIKAVLARVEGDTAVAIRYAEKNRVLLPAIEEKFGAALANLGYGAMALQLGLSYQVAGDFTNAEKHLQKSMIASQKSGNFIAMCACIFELCRIWHQQGRLQEAEATCRQILDLSTKPKHAGWPAFFLVHIALADILILRNQFSETNHHIQQGLALGQQSGHIYYLAHGYLVAERLHIAQNNVSAAQLAHREATRLLTMINLNLSDLQVSAHPFTQAMTQNGFIESLTPRELDVLHFIAAGFTNQEIANDLTLSLNTVKTHIKSLYGKLNAHSRAQAINIGRARGLLS